MLGYKTHKIKWLNNNNSQKLKMKRKFTKMTAALALLVFMTPSMVGWGQTVNENDVLWTEPFGGNPSSSTTFSETTSWGDYINPTTFVATDVSSLSYTSSNAMANGGTATNMVGAHVWLNKSVDSYIQISGIKLYNTTKVKVSWAQATSGSLTTVYYQFDGTGDFTELSSCSGPNANYMSSELSVENHTTIALKFFHPSANAKNTRIDNLTLTATEVSGGTPTCATPTFSPAAGTYSQAKSVTIDCATSGAAIHYTLDGSDPTESSPTYSTAINISQTTTVKAMATATGYNNSAIASATYTITTPSTIAEVRAQGTGNVFTQGIVTSCVGTTGYIQDATAAICVYGASLTVGNEITVAGTLSTYNGLLEITSPVVDVISSGNTVNPELMTIAQVNASTNQGWYVRIENATVTAISGSGNSQNTTIAQGDNTIVVYGNLGVTVAVNDVVSLNGNIGNHNAVQIANPQNVEVQVNTDPVINVTNSSIELAYNATSGEIEYNISNPVTGTSLNATTTAEWISNINVGASSVTFTTAVNESNYERSATITLSYTGAQNVVVTVTQAPFVIDYAVLPFQYAGGVLSDFLALVGTSHSLNDQGSYAEGNAPYRIKFTKTGDYLQVKTDSQPGIVTIGVKMLGGASTSKITVQGSADGVTFTDIQELTISGNQNDILTLETTNAFASTDRYVRLYFTKGSNVGVGPITIAKVSNTPIIVLESNTVELDYDATSGSVGYSITNPVEGVNLQATTEADWISNITVGANTVTFTAAENEGEEDRSATITLSYTGATNKTVTVTQGHFTQEYTLTISNPANVTISAVYGADGVLTNGESDGIANGTEITVTLNIANGYILDVIEVVGENSQTATVSPTSTAGVYKFDMPAFDATLNVSAITVPATEFTLATSITSGKQYIIVGQADGDYYAMGNDKGNNRYAYGITLNGNTASASIAINGVHEFTITSLGEGYYSIMDATTNGGYLCTASGGNYLKTEAALDANHNGDWKITIIDGSFSVVADQSNYRNVMQFNNSSILFACYASASQHPVFLYEKVESETYTLNITGYAEGSTGGYKLIASPVTVDPASVAGMTTGNFDLYEYDDTQDKEWLNWKGDQELSYDGHFNLVPGKGYLYAKQATTAGETFNFTLTGAPYNNQAIQLIQGWNLIGNPLGETAYLADGRNFYRMNAAGSGLIVNTDTNGGGNAINAMEGVFVNATETGTITFTTTAPVKGASVALNVTRDRGNVIDNAVVRFGEGDQLPKFQLFENSTKLYIPQGNEDFAVVRSANQGEMPVSFKAAENGTYTINVDVENMEMDYLHLIDNMTGADVDLLATPSYSFEARTTDYTSRFRLVFSGNGTNENGATTVSETFAYFNGSEWQISNMGEATLQVIDVTGRIVKNETISGNASISINETPGVYMMRLVSGNDVKVQKVVVR